MYIYVAFIVAILNVSPFKLHISNKLHHPYIYKFAFLLIKMPSTMC